LAEAPAASGKVLRHGELTLDPQRYHCDWGTAEVLLTVTEFSLLQSLLGMPGKVYTRDELVDRAWGLGHAITDRTVDSHIRRIRKKFAVVDADPVAPVYGMAYRLRACAPRSAGWTPRLSPLDPWATSAGPAGP